MRGLHIILTTCVLLLGCKVTKRAPGTADASPPSASSPEGGAQGAPIPADLRGEVIAKTVFYDRPEYTPTDPAIVDPCIAAASDGSSATPTKRPEIVDAAARCLFKRLTTETTEPLEKKLAERYENPVITRDGDLVRVDAGIPAGKPTKTARDPLSVESPHVELSDWKASEVVRFFTKGMKAHPDAKTYQVEIEIPRRWSKGDATYVYDRADDRIRIYRSDRSTIFYATGKLAGDLTKVTSLHWSHLTSSPIDKTPVRSFDLRKSAAK